MTRSARVLVVSTRAAAEQYADRTGPVIREWLVECGFETPEPVVVADADIAAALPQVAGREPRRAAHHRGHRGVAG